MDDEPAPPHVVLLASPGTGHLIPLVELARRLVTGHGFAATLVTRSGYSDAATDAAVLSSLPASVQTAVLPPVAVDDLPADVDYGVLMFELVRRSLPDIRALIETSSSRSTAALVCDFFSTSALDLAPGLGLRGYVFFPNSLNLLSIMRRVAELHDGAAPGEHLLELTLLISC